MFVLGLTGSIAMGKSWGARCFRYLGVPVHDADVCVHRLLAPGGQAVESVLRAFPGVEDDKGGVDRRKLGDVVFGHRAELMLLEHILHPLVYRSEQNFLAHHARAGRPLVVLDIPLLFEVGGQDRVDGVVVMSASTDLQYSRALRRPGMTLEKLHAIMDHQVPDQIKRLGADFVINTRATKGHSLQQIKKLIDQLKKQNGKVWAPNWSRPKLIKDRF
jgi:dephospho-CoA kinase